METFMTHPENKKVNFTELELHLIQHYRDSEPIIYPDMPYHAEHHVLEEFVDGYTNARDAYSDGSEEQEQLMDSFLKIAKADIDGGFEYTSGAFEIVIKALNTFGL